MNKLSRGYLIGAAVLLLLIVGVVAGKLSSQSSLADEKPLRFDVMIDSGDAGPDAHPCVTDPKRSCFTIRLHQSSL